MAESNNTEKRSLKDTLNLPTTDFPIRPNHKEDDARVLKRWQDENIYAKTFSLHEGAEKFVLHDGPPYANGHIHIGHAYNKTLKDIITKYHRMSGKHVPVTPGWDCHGLPIELKVTQEHPGLTRSELQRACRLYARKWIDIQRHEFKSLGVFMDWDRPYETMNFAYEAATMRSFASLVEKGYIEKKNKTVAWCFSCQTVLASAEIEYQERKDPSIYVAFALAPTSLQQLMPALAGKKVSMLVWTTTPWTLPLNRAVLLKPDAHYDVIAYNDEYLIVGAPLVDNVVTMLGIEKNVIATIKASAFEGHTVQHPFNGKTVPVLLEQFVSVEDGTAVVHCAPGCGPEDYEVGLRHKLEIYSPVGPDGRYIPGIEPQELVGMSVVDAQGWVISQLLERGLLVHKTSIRHSYPHCWRCRNGLIFRATTQWFCNLDRHQLKEKAIHAIENKIEFIPKTSANSLKAAVGNRLEWCLSRQRIWGVPIPALLCTACDYAYLDAALVQKVAMGVEKEGVEYWDSVSLAELVPASFACTRCGGTHWKKEQDILDVWFDSGISHEAVLKENKALSFPASMYLEGRDQARGWFQSSLLTSLALEGEPSMKTIVTHGYTVDSKGQKMSKSLGNVVSPQEIIDMMGTDGLRLWAASIDFKDDAVISKQLLQNVQEVFRKIRNTCRFLLSNLYDYNHEYDAVPVEELLLMDRYALLELDAFNREVHAAYKDSRFTAVFHLLGDYCATQLSSLYLDIIKDRLYVDQAHGKDRRSAQTVCYYILDTMTRLMAPLMTFTAELVSDHYQQEKKESVHLQQFIDSSAVATRASGRVGIESMRKEWELILTLRDTLLKAIERKREMGLIKHPLEASIFLSLDRMNPVFEQLLQSVQKEQSLQGKTLEDFFKELMVVSQVHLVDETTKLTEFDKGVFVEIAQAEGEKCPRCWHYEKTEHELKLCQRCQRIIDLLQ